MYWLEKAGIGGFPILRKFEGCIHDSGGVSIVAKNQPRFPRSARGPADQSGIAGEGEEGGYLVGEAEWIGLFLYQKGSFKKTHFVLNGEQTGVHHLVSHQAIYQITW